MMGATAGGARPVGDADIDIEDREEPVAKAKAL
jgi:hypothetical protein